MALPILPREAQLVLLSAGGPECDAPIRALLQGGLDWEIVTRIAARERAASILWQRLRALSGAAQLPQGAAALKATALVFEFRQNFLEQRLRESLAALNEARLRVVLLKGAALGLTVYGATARRPMGDIDLLVAPEDTAEVQRLLLQRVWRERRTAGHERFYTGHHHLPPLEDRGNWRIGLELHTDLLPRGHPFEPLRRMVWEEARPLSEQQPTLLVPRLSHHLLYLCVHFAWSHLLSAGAWRTLRDVTAIVASGEIEWEEFTRAARETRGVTCCYWTLRLARNLLQVPVPPEVLAALHPQVAEPILALLERHLIHQLLPSTSLCPSLRLSYAVWRLAVRPGWSGHGSLRPWDRTDAFKAEAPTNGEAHGSKLLNHVRNARGWGTYLAAVLPSPSRRWRAGRE